MTKVLNTYTEVDLELMQARNSIPINVYIGHVDNHKASQLSPSK